MACCVPTASDLDLSGGGQEFVRPCARGVYGIPPQQIIGSALATKYGYEPDGEPVAGPRAGDSPHQRQGGQARGHQSLHRQRPSAAFGNSTGDRQMLEWTTAARARGCGMLVLHDDAEREYAYGPANGLPDTKVGTFTQGLMDEAKKRGWPVISMKNDWKRVFPFKS